MMHKESPIGRACLFIGVFGKLEGLFWLLRAGSNHKS